MQRLVDRFTGGALRLRTPTWTMHVRLRRAQATRYRRGRVLVAGDAAHLHSPAGAQGMNTGIHDACNLAWKLALVVGNGAPDRLLDSYQAERWPVARRTRQLTDLAFLLEAADHAPLRWLREHAVPPLLPLVRGRTIPTAAFRLVAGLTTRYRGSPLVVEGTPRLHRGPRAGDRLPDGDVLDAGSPSRLHEVLAAPTHHLLLCDQRDRFGRTDQAQAVATCTVPVRIHRLTRMGRPGVLADPGGGLLRRLGVVESAVYLVRPDGYVAYRAGGSDLCGALGHLRAVERTGTSGLAP